MPSLPRIFVCSGETSGDHHAARLIENLFRLMPASRVVAMGGDRCLAAGAELVHHSRDYAILGFTGVARNLIRLFKLEKSLKHEVESCDLFIAVDYPGMNLRLAEHARRHRVPVLYYISPQVWAWGSGRVEKIAHTVDRMAVILPFEVDVYKNSGLDVEFVGHPFLVDHEPMTIVPETERRGIGLLPGSREQEVRRVLPVLIEAARLLRESFPGERFSIGRSPAISPKVYGRILEQRQFECAIDDDAGRVMRQSKVAMVASGTATLQCALQQTPLVVVYRVSPLNYALARRLIKIDNIGLVNVVLGEMVAPEFIQNAARAEGIAAAVSSLMPGSAHRRDMLKRFATLPEILSGGRGSERVAEMAIELISG